MWQSNSLSASAGVVSRKVVLTLSLAARTSSSAGSTKPSLTGATFGVLKRKPGLVTPTASVNIVRVIVKLLVLPHPHRQPRVEQPCRGQACADTPAAPRRAGTRRQRPGGAHPHRSAVRSPPAASGSAPR